MSAPNQPNWSSLQSQSHGWGAQYSQPSTHAGDAEPDARAFEDDHVFIPNLHRNEWFANNPSATEKDYQSHLSTLPGGTATATNQRSHTGTVSQTGQGHGAGHGNTRDTAQTQAFSGPSFTPAGNAAGAQTYVRYTSNGTTYWIPVQQAAPDYGYPGTQPTGSGYSEYNPSQSRQ